MSLKPRVLPPPLRAQYSPLVSANIVCLVTGDAGSKRTRLLEDVGRVASLYGLFECCGSSFVGEAVCLFDDLRQHFLDALSDLARATREELS